jgi:Ca2+-binding EF-hand superfamily protein
MTSTKDPVRKTELFFSMYDIDRNGLIDENEMRCVVEVCFWYTYRCFSICT